MATNRVNPYTRLLEQFHAFAQKARAKKPVTMFVYKKADIDAELAWPLGDLRQRILAAKQLGREVEILEMNGDLVVQYVNRRPEYPL